MEVPKPVHDVLGLEGIVLREPLGDRSLTSNGSLSMM